MVSHKPCWESPASPSGYASSGGFPFQMEALAELFDETVLLVPIIRTGAKGEQQGEIALSGYGMSIAPLSQPSGSDLSRKAALPGWLLANMRRLLREISRADVVHTPIPSDLGTIGMLLALLLRKRLFVRYCGNWGAKRTNAERFWHWFMERYAGGGNVMLATGGGRECPSPRNKNIEWIFSTSLTREEIACCRTERSSPNREAPRLITVARQERSKGTETLIRALPPLLEEIPGLRLDVIGEGSALPYFRRLAVSLGLNDTVNFHGQQGHDRVIDLLKASDLFCLPTASEGFPKSVLEAMACGLPVITTSVSVLPELIGEECGILVPVASPPDAYGAAIRRCLADQSRYAAMSRAATGRAASHSLEEWQTKIGNRLGRAGYPLRER